MLSYDSNSKTFRGCLGRLSVYAGATKSFPEPCVAVTTCAELQDLLVSSARTGTISKICSNTTPIDCQATRRNDVQLTITNTEIGDGTWIARAQCISPDLASEPCILDLSPATTYSAASPTYTSIIVRDENTLLMEGFQFQGVRGNSRVVYHQDSSNWICRGCRFTGNIGALGTRGVISRDYTAEPPCGVTQKRGNAVYENSFFDGNVGEVSSAHIIMYPL